MSEAKEKNLALAIGLNLLLPGVGYMYFGRIFIGIVGLFLVGGIMAATSVTTVATTWFVMNAVMAIDMVILNNKNKKKVVAASMMKCPHCAELIQKEAKICRFCSSEISKGEVAAA